MVECRLEMSSEFGFEIEEPNKNASIGRGESHKLAPESAAVIFKFPSSFQRASDPRREGLLQQGARRVEKSAPTDGNSFRRPLSIVETTYTGRRSVIAHCWQFAPRG